MKWKMVTYYKEFNGHEDSITGYFTASVRRAKQVRKNCEKLCNELLKRQVYRNYRVVIERMDDREVLEKLRGYCKGIYEDCNDRRCDLCYIQNANGEASIEVAIRALQNQILEKGGDAID